MLPVAQYSTQAGIYSQLRQNGSSWLKKHIIYADRQLIVLNKPPGLVCQTNHKQESTDADLALHFRGVQHWITSEPHPVHRLDKGTTGCLLIAANQTASKAISRQFQKGTVHKKYLALVQGGKHLFQESSGRIKNRILYINGQGSFHEDGKEAITEWKLLSSSPKVPLSLVQMNLLTGNKHQLRLHLARCLEAPILGDSLYSPSPVPSAVYGWTMVPKNRVFLHASEISLFRYLQTGLRFRLGIRAPLPADFKKICRDVGIVIPQGLGQEGQLISETRVPNHPELKELKLWSQARENSSHIKDYNKGSNKGRREISM